MDKDEFEAEKRAADDQLVKKQWEGALEGKSEAELKADFDAGKQAAEAQLVKKFWEDEQRALNKAQEKARQDNVDKTEMAANKGCLTGSRSAFGIATLVLLVVAFLVAKSELDSGGCDSQRPRRDGVVLAACQKPADTAASSTSDSNSSSDTASSSSSSSSGGTAGGGTASIAPPDASSLPKGAILFQGQSGANIGFIAQDGLSRYMPVPGTGISTDANSVAVVWDKGPGKVVSFGTNLHTSTNNGRYGFALFRNTPATPPTTSPSGEADSPYRAGCAIEIGQTSCKSDTVGAPIANGDKVTLIIGEQGHLDATGDYAADWWFVFQPD